LGFVPFFTFSGVKSERIAVGPFPATVEGFHAGVVKRIEMQAVHCADGLFAAVNLLQRKISRENSLIILALAVIVIFLIFI
jgi:hypothetical protein